jgi:hypothetical protein
MSVPVFDIDSGMAPLESYLHADQIRSYSFNRAGATGGNADEHAFTCETGVAKH